MITHESTFYNHRDDQSPLAADPVLQGPNDRRCQMLGELQTGMFRQRSGRSMSYRNVDARRTFCAAGLRTKREPESRATAKSTAAEPGILSSKAENNVVHGNVDFVEHVGGVDIKLGPFCLPQGYPAGNFFALLDLAPTKIADRNGRTWARTS
jgi:hypothetical protein